MSVESQNEIPEARQEALWIDKGIVTLSFRRHSSYERDPNSGRRGALVSKENVAAADSAAYSFAKHLPQGAEVSFYQSPSFMIARKTEGGRVIKPMRAAVTASRYEQVIRGPYGSYVSERTSDDRLGDIFEHGNEKIPLFYQAIKENYGGMTPDFWDDYLKRNLKPEVARAFSEANGSRPEMLANELSNFISDTSERLRQKGAQSKKEVGLVITHGEKIESFLYYLANYLNSTGYDTSTIQEVVDADIDYNQGFDLHLSPEGGASLELRGQIIEFDYNQFNENLGNEDRDGANQAI